MLRMAALRPLPTSLAEGSRGSQYSELRNLPWLWAHPQLRNSGFLIRHKVAAATLSRSVPTLIKISSNPNTNAYPNPNPYPKPNPNPNTNPNPNPNTYPTPYPNPSPNP